jgi:hypothetical protein
VATPETRNSSDSRHGELSIMNGSSAGPAAGLLMCQSQVT